MSTMFAQNAAAFTTPPVTIKKRATADEIQADLQERIDRLAARDEKFRGMHSVAPAPLARSDGQRTELDRRWIPRPAVRRLRPHGRAARSGAQGIRAGWIGLIVFRTASILLAHRACECA